MKRLVFMIVLLAVLVSPVLFLFAAMEPAALVARRLDSTPADAARTREVFREFRRLTEEPGRREIVLSEADMNGGLAFAMRAVAQLRGRARITPEALRVSVSADARRLPGGGWLNLRVAIRPSARGLELATVRLGSFRLPEGLILPAVATVLDLVLGDGLGQVAIRGIDGVAIRGDTVVFGVGLDRAGRKALARRAKETVRRSAGLGSVAEVQRYVRSLARAAGDGRIRPDGSVVAFLRHALGEAEQASGPDGDVSPFKAALLALGIYCGHVKFQNIVGEVVPRDLPHPTAGCDRATLAGRGDLRKHFVISAGLKVAGDSGFAFAIGEFKELLDSNEGGSGFSFDDLTADRAGIRFAEAFMGADPATRAWMIERLTGEEAILPTFADLPSGLSETAFRQRFGDAGSAAYEAMVAEIDRRVAALPLYAPR